jgi:tetratricopeptide (TPR) repeat protein
MKKVNQLFGVGPERAAQLERVGIRAISDLAETDNLEQVSVLSGVPTTVLNEWRQMARLEIQTSGYKHKVVVSLIAVTLVLFILLAFWSFQETSFVPVDSYGQAIMLYEEGNFTEAAFILDESFAQEESSADHHNLRGILYRIESRAYAARTEYEKAIALDQDFAAAWNNLGNVDLDLKNYNVATEHYKKAITLNPQSALYHYNLARAWEALGEVDEAEKEYKLSENF